MQPIWEFLTQEIIAEALPLGSFEAIFRIESKFDSQPIAYLKVLFSSENSVKLC